MKTENKPTASDIMTAQIREVEKNLNLNEAERKEKIRAIVSKRIYNPVGERGSIDY